MHVLIVDTILNTITSFDYSDDTLVSTIIDEVTQSSLTKRYYVKILHGINYVYIDLGLLLSEVDVSELPSSIVGLLNYLQNDQIVGGYSVSNIYYNKQAKIRSINDLGLKAEFVSVDNPSKRYPLSDNPKGLDDIVFSDYTDGNLNNLIVFVNGKVKKTIMFENELYILESADDFININEIYYLDTTELGGHQTIQFSEQNYIFDEISKTLFIHLSPELSFVPPFNHTPILSIMGNLYLPADKVYQIVTPEIISINLQKLYGVYDIPTETLAQQIVTHQDSMIFSFSTKVYIKETLLKPSSYQYTYEYSDEVINLGLLLNLYNHKVMPYRSLTKSNEYTKNNIYRVYVKFNGKQEYPVNEYDLVSTNKNIFANISYLNKKRIDPLKLISFIC
jgi:hypothetical protein